MRGAVLTCCILLQLLMLGDSLVSDGKRYWLYWVVTALNVAVLAWFI
ncbi:MAG: hypothetical protein R3Y45_01100 [Bacillota bacterium]